MTESRDEHNTRISIKISLFLMYSEFFCAALPSGRFMLYEIVLI